MKEKIDWRIVVAGLIGIVILEAIALFKGINGVVLTSVIGVIAGVIGWTAPQLKVK